MSHFAIKGLISIPNYRNCIGVLEMNFALIDYVLQNTFLFQTNVFLNHGGSPIELLRRCLNKSSFAIRNCLIKLSFTVFLVYSDQFEDM